MFEKLAARFRASDTNHPLLVPLLISTMLVQLITAVVRVTTSYRAVELNLRLKTERRGHFTAKALLEAATNHTCLGWDDVGRIAPGYQADFITLDLTSPRLETAEPATMLESIVFAATAADVC